MMPIEVNTVDPFPPRKGASWATLCTRILYRGKKGRRAAKKLERLPEVRRLMASFRLYNVDYEIEL